MLAVQPVIQSRFDELVKFVKTIIDNTKTEAYEKYFQMFYPYLAPLSPLHFL